MNASFYTLIVKITLVVVFLNDFALGDRFRQPIKITCPNAYAQALPQLAKITATIASTNIFFLRSAWAKNENDKLDISNGAFSVDEAAALILRHCSKIVDAARLTGHVLYRGEGNEGPQSCRLVFTENTSDLLSNGTYTSNPSAASEFFSSLDGAMFAAHLKSIHAGQNLSRVLSFQPDSLPSIAERCVRPLYAHLATSDIQAASEWGVPVSVWPLDTGLHFAWLRTQSTWWKDEWTAGYNAPPSSPRRRGSSRTWKETPYFWRNPSLLEGFVSSEIKVDVALETALYAGKEVLDLILHAVLFVHDFVAFILMKVMFTSGVSAGSSPLKWHLSYITVPLSDEPALLRKLQITPFDSKAKVTLTKPMDLDGEAIRRRRLPAAIFN